MRSISRTKPEVTRRRDSSATRTSSRRKLLRRRSLRPYLHLVRILLKDSVWRFKIRTIFVLAASTIAVTLQGTALLFALRYARWLEKDTTIHYLGRAWEPRSSLELLWLFAGGVAVLFGLSAVLTYFSRTQSLSLRRRYELVCSKRALELLSALRRVTPAAGLKVANDAMFIRVARSDARYAGRVLFSLINGIVPALTFVAVIGGLLFLKLELTLILLGVMALSTGFLYRVNRMGALASKHMEETSPEASNEYKRAIRWMRGATFPPPDDPDWLVRSVIDNVQTRRHFKAYELRLRVVEDARLVSNIVAAVAFLAIIGTFGTQIINSGTGFGMMAVYLVALRRGTSSFREVNQALSGMTRFYPQIKRYFAFTETSESLLSEGDSLEQPRPLRLDVTQPSLDDSLPSWIPDDPSRVGLMAPIGLDRYSLAVLVDSLFGGADTPGARYVLRRSALVTARYDPLARLPFRTSIGVPPDWGRDRLVDELSVLGLDDSDVGSLPELDKPCDDDHWRRVGEHLRFGLAVLSARRSSAEWIFLDERGLLSLSEEQRAAFLDALDGRYVVIAYSYPKTEPGRHGERIVGVIDGERLIGLGSAEWFLGQRAAAETALREGPLAEIGRLGAIHDDEEEDETEEDDDIL